jgi:hypothetical protein
VITPEDRQNERLRVSNLIQELDVAMQLIETGLAILQRSRLYRAKYFAFLLLLTSGLERLMKIILILRVLHTEKRYLTKNELRVLGHDLLNLRQQVLDSCFTSDYCRRQLAQQDRTFIERDSTLAQLFDVLSDFARKDRYAYMDGVAEPIIWEEGPPDQRWEHLEFSQISLAEVTALFKANQDDVAKQRSVQQLIISLERGIRALARLFLWDALGDRGKSIGTAPGVWSFAMLNDADLGTRVYSFDDDPK